VQHQSPRVCRTRRTSVCLYIIQLIRRAPVCWLSRDKSRDMVRRPPIDSRNRNSPEITWSAVVLLVSAFVCMLWSTASAASKSITIGNLLSLLWRSISYSSIFAFGFIAERISDSCFCFHVCKTVARVHFVNAVGCHLAETLNGKWVSPADKDIFRQRRKLSQRSQSGAQAEIENDPF